MDIKVLGTEFDTASEAVQNANAAGRGEVVSVEDRYFLVNRLEAERLERLGVVGAYWYDQYGRIVSVPVK